MPESLRAYDFAPSWWMVRVETDGNGGLVETPIRPLRPHEVAVLEAAIAERSKPPQTMRDELDADMQVRRDRILNVLAAGPMTTTETATAAGIDRQAARYALRRMHDEGKVTFDGRCWRIAQDDSHAE